MADVIRREKEVSETPLLFLASCAKENGDMEQKRGVAKMMLAKNIFRGERERLHLPKCFFPNSKSTKAGLRIFFAFLLSLSFIFTHFSFGG